MRVAYVCADPGVPVFGNKGCSIHVQEIVRAMLARGDEVELFVARTGGEPPKDLAKCLVHEMAIPRCADTRAREVEQVLWNQRVTRALNKRGAFDLVYERHSLWSVNAMCWAQHKGIPSVLEVNAPLIDEQTQHRQLDQTRLACVMARRAMRNAAFTYTVSEAIVPYCRRFVASHDPVHVIPNGVNTDRFSPEIPAVDPFTGFTVGFVGSLKPWHGLDALIDAYFRFCPLTTLSSEQTHPPIDCRLLIVGDGPQRDVLEKQLEDRIDLRHEVKFVGAVRPEAVPSWISSMDVVVAPYPKLDNFYFSPLKLFEYMASGRAVLASTTGQIRELIQHGDNGWLYSPGSVDQLVASLLSLRENPALCAKLGEAARVTSLKHGWDQVLDQILSGVSETNTLRSNANGLRDEIKV